MKINSSLALSVLYLICVSVATPHSSVMTIEEQEPQHSSIINYVTGWDFIGNNYYESVQDQLRQIQGKI